MKLHILAAKQESAPILEEASTLLERKKESQSKEQLLEAFRKHFLLSDEDINILTSSAQPVTEHFFQILKRVQLIHKDCEILLGEENQRLGLELMEQSTRYLDAAFKKLYTWIQREFKGIDLEDPRISSSIRRALRTLSERPTLFQNCLDFFAEARDITLAESFQAALTGTASTQAIEFSTHDPLRYVGDMLAWMHSAAVSEKEALEGLFIADAADDVSRGLSTGTTAAPWARIQGQAISAEGEDEAVKEQPFDGHKALGDLIGRNMASVCQTLRQRIELSTRNGGDAVLMYKVYSLLFFYSDIFRKLLGSETQIDVTLRQLRESILKLFEETMEQDISSSTAGVVLEAELEAPQILQTVLKQFTDICRSRGPQMDDQELGNLFSIMLTPVLNACAEGAAQLRDPRLHNIYKANYLLMLRSSLESVKSHVSHVEIPLEKVSKELSVIRENLISLVTTTLLDESGVNALLQEADARRDQHDRREWFKQGLGDAALVLDEFLASGLMDAQEAFSNLKDKGAAKEIVAEAVERFCGEFEELESMIVSADRAESDGMADGDPAEGEADAVASLRDLYPRVSAEVRALLS